MFIKQSTNSSSNNGDNGLEHKTVAKTISQDSIHVLKKLFCELETQHKGMLNGVMDITGTTPEAYDKAVSEVFS